MTVVRESLEGDIGDDWTYTVGATVLNPTAVGTGDITAYRHVLGEKISALPYVAQSSTYVAMEAVKDEAGELG